MCMNHGDSNDEIIIPELYLFAEKLFMIQI